MKRIAIMTWYSYQNYGTALQAVALNRAIRGLGYEAYDLQYDPVPFQAGKPNKRGSLFKRAAAKIDYLRRRYPINDSNRDKAFNAFLEQHLPLTNEVISHENAVSVSHSYDAFVCGSDQVWSPRCFDSLYYLDFVSDSKKIAYAPSFGCDEIESYPESMQIKGLVSRFESISVREQSGADIVESITGKRPPVVVDPTMLLTAVEWDRLAKPVDRPSGPYCLFYFLGSYSKNYAAAVSIAKERGLEILELPVFAYQLKDSRSAGPEVGPGEFIDLIRNASLICTDSFHGMVFATIYNLPFVAFERFDPRRSDSQNTRVYNFLNMTNQSGTLLQREDLSRWRKCSRIHINEQEVSSLLAKARASSVDYLSDSLRHAAGGVC